MCFSAIASYVASASLLLCGIAALYRSKKNQRLFAAIPVLFAAQQFIEGTIWQTLAQGNSALLGTYAYLSFVYIIWPNWIPFSIYQMSTIAEKKKLGLPILAGVLTSILAIAYMFTHQPMAAIIENHISYSAQIPDWLWIPGTALYLTATITPFFIPKIPNLSLMGIVLSLSYMAAFLFYFNYILSIWCFFAAILSVFVLLVLR